MGRIELSTVCDGCTTAGDNNGEGLIVYIRDELNLRIPLIVMSILGHDSQLKVRLEPYEIPYILGKGGMNPYQFKEIVETALSDFNPERATRLNLRSKNREERKVGLLAASKMKPSPKLHKALVRLESDEDDPELREMVASILKNYPPNIEPGEVFDDEREKLPVESSLPEEYDVFLSHNSADKYVVETLAQQLAKIGVHSWLDKWNLIPGEPWQEAIEKALDACQTVAVFLGPNGVGPWENEEMRSALEERVHDKSRRVIPVLLPGASELRDRSLPRFLRRLTWVDFRNGLDDKEAFRSLIAGIRGIPPGSGKL